MTKSLNPNNNQNSNDAMEVDAIDQCKGKTKGSNQYCSICQQEGHWTSECYYNPQNNNDAPSKAKGMTNYNGGKQNND